MAIGGDDISNDVTTLVFQCLFAFALLPLRADWRKFDSSVVGEKGNWRWNSNSRGLVASSPSFSCPAGRAPWRACSQANKRILIVSSILLNANYQACQSTVVTNSHCWIWIWFHVTNVVCVLWYRKIWHLAIRMSLLHNEVGWHKFSVQFKVQMKFLTKRGDFV